MTMSQQSISNASRSLEDRIAFGQKALTSIVDAMPLIRFDSEKRPHLYAVTLHTSVVQLCGGCFALARTEHTAGIPILLRSMFEALVDLDNLVHDADFHERMDAANLVQFLKLLREAPANPLLAGLDKKHNLAAITAEFKEELGKLSARKGSQKNLRERCIDVGRENEYASIYTLLCLDAHNNTTALFDRHLSQNDAQELRVDAFGDGNPLGLARRVFTACGWMIESAQLVHGAFGTGLKLDQLISEHESLRSLG
jgi:hypothetical protein